MYNAVIKSNLNLVSIYYVSGSELALLTLLCLFKPHNNPVR